VQSHWTKPFVFVDWQTLLTDSLTYFNVSVGLRHMIHFLFFQKRCLFFFCVQKTVFSHILTSLSEVMPERPCQVENTRIPRQRNLLRPRPDTGDTTHCFAKRKLSLCTQAGSKAKSWEQSVVQRPSLLQVWSFEPTNSHLVGASSWQQSWRGLKDTWYGTNFLCWGKSYQISVGKTALMLGLVGSFPACQAYPWLRRNALSGVQGAGWLELARADPPVNEISEIRVTWALQPDCATPKARRRT